MGHVEQGTEPGTTEKPESQKFHQSFFIRSLAATYNARLGYISVIKQYIIVTPTEVTKRYIYTNYNTHFSSWQNRETYCYL